MGSVRGCEFPEALSYNVDDNMWARLEQDGTVTVGMTSYAVSLSGQVVAYTPKKVGKEVKKGRSCATVESGKWVGPAKAPVSGEVVAINEDLTKNPGLLNEEPYGAAWLVKIKPADWEGDSKDLIPGADAQALFEEKMEADGFGGC
jgi:glycine cleavage system H protein